MSELTALSDDVRVVTIKKYDEDRQMVWGEVYAPFVIDTWGDMMLPVDIETMAHRYLRDLAIKETIDTNHDQKSNGSYPIESFIARDNDPDYTPGAWVLGVKVEDADIWTEIKKGNLNGFSFQALVRKVPSVVQIDIVPENIILTEENLGHTHIAYVRINDDGQVIGGRTSTDFDHSHEIFAGTATEEAKMDGKVHRHRYFI
jgi:hypothetical protein